jgi:imidazolonepropionase-like amidohydrolase
MKPLLVLLLGLALPPAASAQGQPIVLRGASAFDGAGRTITNATIVVRDGKIVSVASDGTSAPAAPKRDSREGGSYDLQWLTILPGLIDTHVHLDTHFGPDGRATTRGETAPQAIL